METTGGTGLEVVLRIIQPNRSYGGMGTTKKNH